MKIYRLEKYGRLFCTTGAFKGPTGIFTSKLLIDTGASYTLIPYEALEKIKKDYTIPRERVKLATANGYILAPIKKVEWIHSLGLRYENFPVVIYNLPTGMFVKGILGMDFLTKARATIDIAKEQIYFSEI
jgi:predicted aspartyl protease